MSLSRNLANVVVKKNIDADTVVSALQKYKLVSLLPSVIASMKHMNEMKRSSATLQVESPFNVDDKALKSIQKIIDNTTSPHTVTINKNLLAGFKARLDGKLYDGSAERIIKQLMNHTN